jgi:hypothetical protein
LSHIAHNPGGLRFYKRLLRMLAEACEGGRAEDRLFSKDSRGNEIPGENHNPQVRAATGANRMMLSFVSLLRQRHHQFRWV